jgi:hypothetical protein
LAGLPSGCTWATLVDGLRLWLLREQSKLPSQSLATVEVLFRSGIKAGIAPRLAWIGPGDVPCSYGFTAGAIHGSEYGIYAVAFVEYAANAYGRDRLPALIEGMKRHDSWETLIPAVYGVSAAEFEAGWQAWLRKDENLTRYTSRQD